MEQAIILGGLEGAAFVKTPYTNQSDDWPDIQFHYVSGSAVADGGQHLRRIVGLRDDVPKFILLELFKHI